MYETKTVFSEIDGKVVTLADGSIEFWLKSTDKWLPANVAAEVSARSPNLPISWRHEIPRRGYNEDRSVLGWIAESKVVDGEIYNKYHVDNFHPDQQKAIADVRAAEEGKGLIGASIGLNYLTKEGSIFRGYGLEYALTPKPDCKTCFLEEDNMGDQDVSKDFEAKIAELEKSKDAAIKEKDVEVKALLKEKEAYESAKVEYEAKIKNLESEKVGFATKIAELEAKTVLLERAPFVAKLKELECPKAWGVYGSFIEKEMTIPTMQARIKELEEAKKVIPAIKTSTLEQTKDKVKSETKTKEEVLATVKDPILKEKLKKEMESQ